MVADRNTPDAFCKLLSIACRFVAIFEKNTDDSPILMYLFMFQGTPTKFSPYLTIDYNRRLSKWDVDNPWLFCFDQLFLRPQFVSHTEISLLCEDPEQYKTSVCRPGMCTSFSLISSKIGRCLRILVQTPHNTSRKSVKWKSQCSMRTDRWHILSQPEGCGRSDHVIDVVTRHPA